MWREPEIIRLEDRCFLSVAGIKHSDQKQHGSGKGWLQFTRYRASTREVYTLPCISTGSLHVTVHQCGKSGRAFNLALVGRPACYSTLLCLWPRNSHTVKSVQQKTWGSTTRWLVEALTQLAFFYSPGLPARGMGPSRVGWSPLWQLTTKIVLHRHATGQSDLGNSSGEVVCVVTSWQFKLTRILLKNIHQNWTYTRLYMSKSWHILVLKPFRIRPHITVEINSK